MARPFQLRLNWSPALTSLGQGGLPHNPGQLLVKFRLATESDWAEIFEVFSAVTSTADTYPYPPGLTSGEAHAIWMAATHTVFVAEDDGEIVGTAYLKPNIPGLGDHICNAGWMIHPLHQGKGIGRPFAEYVIEQASEQYRAMQFNAVVSTNTAAVALWESLGFDMVGTVPDAFRHPDGLTAVHIMYREL